MTEPKKSRKQDRLEAGVEEMRLENGDTHRERGALRTDDVKVESRSRDGSSQRTPMAKSASQSPVKHGKLSQSPNEDSEKHEEVVGGEVTVKLEPGHPPKLARSTSRKIVAGPAQLFNEYPSRTDEATSTFQVLSSCIYSSKYIGSTEHEAMDCDCTEEWGKAVFTIVMDICL